MAGIAGGGHYPLPLYYCHFTPLHDAMRPSGWTVLLVATLLLATIMVLVHGWSLDVGRGGLNPITLGGDDGVYYIWAAEQIASKGVILPGTLITPWPRAVGHISGFLGAPPLVVFKVVILLSVALVLWYGLKLLDAVSRGVAGRAPPPSYQVVTVALLAFFPSAVFFGLFSLYRDAAISAAFLACAYYGHRFFVMRNPRLLGLMVSLIVLFALRWYAAVAFSLGTGAWVVLTGMKGRRKGLVLAVTAAGAGVMTALLYGMGFFQNAMAFLLAREGFSALEAGSNLGISFADTPPWGWPAVYVYSFLTNVLGPFPFQVSGLATLLGATLEAPFLMYVVYRLWRGNVRYTPAGRYLIYVALAWFALIAIYNDNIGTALRLRFLGVQLLFVLLVCEVWACRAASAAVRVVAPTHAPPLGAVLR